jgi:hypothetical protein
MRYRQRKYKTAKQVKKAAKWGFYRNYHFFIHLGWKKP